METVAVHLRFVLHTLWLSISRTQGCSDYRTFLEAVKAAQAHEDERAIELLAKSEEAIEEVVSILEERSPAYCSDPLSEFQAKAWGITFVAVCGKTSLYPPVNPPLTIESRSHRGQHEEAKLLRSLLTAYHLEIAPRSPLVERSVLRLVLPTPTYR